MPVSDLYKTAMPPDAPQEARGIRRRLLLLPSWVLPLFIIVAFAGLFAVVYRDRLMPALPVNVTPAILLADIEPETAAAGAKDKKNAGRKPAAGGKMLFQAGGWFEPDPLPIYAIALTDGVIRTVHVLEGQEVTKGQLLAELISEDAQIALSAAERAHDRASAEFKLQEVQVSVAEAEAAVMADQVRVAEAKLAEERDNQARVSRLTGGSVSDQERTRAKFLVEGQVAEVAARKSQQLAAVAKVAAARAQSTVLQAALAAAAVEVEKNKLALSRTRIHSPVDGVILELHAAPGQKKLLAMDDHQSATIATLFEKGKLQARVDVPLADASGLTTGQEAVITSDFLPNTEFRGLVSRIVGAANLQRNTLQAKVRVLNPDPRLRPEMLCRVKFLGPGEEARTSADASSAGSARQGDTDSSRAIMVPEEAVVFSSGADAALWVVGQDGATANRRPVTLGGLKREGHVSVSSGVLAGELVILPPHDPLAEGRRVQPNLISR